jgi:DUF971 family protein
MSQDTFQAHKAGPVPVDIVLHQASRQLELVYETHGSFKLSFELMRVYSPSAEVRGHGIGQEVLQTGKTEVGILKLELVGNYAVKPTFSDGHDTGLFAWPYLYELASEQARFEAEYVAKLQDAGLSRGSTMGATQRPTQSDGGCSA